MRYEIEKTEAFDKWLKKLKDRKAVVAIAGRLDRAIIGNFGDVSPVGEGICEMRFFVGPGYRLYYTIRQNTIILMLCGGDKSTQEKDNKKAKKMAKAIYEETVKVKTSPYNPLDYLETKEEINEYLNNAFMDDDPQVFLVALGFLAKKKGMMEVAKETGLNRESLYKSLSGDGNPKFSTISKVTKALGCKLAVT